jgi:hypothetical protein
MPKRERPDVLTEWSSGLDLCGQHERQNDDEQDPDNDLNDEPVRALRTCVFDEGLPPPGVAVRAVGLPSGPSCWLLRTALVDIHRSYLAPPSHEPARVGESPRSSGRAAVRHGVLPGICDSQAAGARRTELMVRYRVEMQRSQVSNHRTTSATSRCTRWPRILCVAGRAVSPSGGTP